MDHAKHMCPFLRNLSGRTSGSLVAAASPYDAVDVKGPILEEGSSFDIAFNMFHGKGGVVPLASSSQDCSDDSTVVAGAPRCPYANTIESALGTSAAAISLSPFGPFGPFSYDSLRSRIAAKKELEKQNKEPEDIKENNTPASHEASGNEWLATGNCPIAKSYRALSLVIPLVAAAVKPPPGIVYRCPPAIIAMRAAVARTPIMQALRPQALHIRTLAIGTIGLMLNVPLGAWREHCVKFSPQWILVVHASVPFVAILRKAALMPNYAMVFTIAASIIGQTIGSRMERRRVKNLQQQALPAQASSSSIEPVSAASLSLPAVQGLPPLNSASPKTQENSNVASAAGNPQVTHGLHQACASAVGPFPSGMESLLAGMVDPSGKWHDDKEDVMSAFWDASPSGSVQSTA